ncbi:MAG: hypothetical protein H6819_03810 [Phycisphaerales bacterium]|nr:hypothetical protein [Phycisphaerales bacterium]MCB9856324.1 hypothetical protein [Phycisphaerales bacterium]
MNTRWIWKMAASAAVCTLIGATGCLKRHEIIQVRENGSVSMKLEYEGSEEDLAGPDALPKAADGWSVGRGTLKRGNEDVHVVRASAEFAPGKPLPSSYGDAGGVYLTFPTQVRREARADGVYFEFRRVYQPRRYALTQYWNDRFIDDDIKKLSERSIESLDQDERTKLLRAFGNVESHQQLEVLGLAVESAIPDISPESRLAARQSLLGVYERFDYEGLADSIKGLSDDEASAKIVKMGEAVPTDAERAFVESLRDHANLTENAIESLRASIERERLRRKVTESTRTQTFQIEVSLPGEIVANNGESIEDGKIGWEFDGRAFCDRPYELIAISRLKAAN